MNLVDDQRIKVGVWYPFQLDVRGHEASLAIGNLDHPLVTFSGSPTASGRLGLEARPGGGEAVWVDDIVVTPLDGKAAPSIFTDDANWEYAGPIEPSEEVTLDPPQLDKLTWHPMPVDKRGVLSTGLLTQFRSGDRSWVYLRHRFTVDREELAPTWLAASSANRLDVWLNGYFRGVIAPERFIWSDFLDNPERPGGAAAAGAFGGREHNHHSRSRP